MSEPKSRLQELVGGLRDQGHRLTPQRMAVLAVLAQSDTHPSIQDIYRQVQADLPMTSLATVYKTIALLKEMGQVLELCFGDKGSRYDGRQACPHPHLICVRCSRVIDWDIDRLGEWTQQVARQSGYQLVGHRLDLLGICPQCQPENH